MLFGSRPDFSAADRNLSFALGCKSNKRIDWVDETETSTCQDRRHVIGK